MIEGEERLLSEVLKEDTSLVSTDTTVVSDGIQYLLLVFNLSTSEF